jgi:putative SOS response-associated peptidase YedK
MCGRFDQSQTPKHYLRALDWSDAANHSAQEPRFNVAPGTYRPVLHVVDGRGAVDDLHWGYQARGVAGKVPVAINARLEKLAGRYWGRLLGAGRAIVPADGWYEWTGEKGHKQPWHIHLKSRKPLFMAAVANFGEFRDHKAEAGFAIVTQDAGGGLLDVHDRRPLVLSAEDALLWMSPNLSKEEAMELVRASALGPEAFDWYPVSKAVGNVTKQGAWLTHPVELEADDLEEPETAAAADDDDAPREDLDAAAARRRAHAKIMPLGKQRLH